MKTVGLLSGGKDSVYTLLHCVAQDHEPVALASLGPGPGHDELDSYMYQTVGHSGLFSIATALGLPLFTQDITGKPLNVGGEYGSRQASNKGKGRGTEGDETEDLYTLLLKVVTAMPEVKAVACGAILSNYQRVRVEHVCARLNLIPIAFLWERNQEELLSEMVSAGMGSVLVKVAGAGLVEEHLGKSLAEMQSTLLRLTKNRRFQLHVCGEGGEYETFTLDCPLFSHRIVLSVSPTSVGADSSSSKTDTILTNPDPNATIAHLRLEECTLEEKPYYPVEEAWEAKRERVRALVRVPDLLDQSSQEVLQGVETAYMQGVETAYTTTIVDDLDLNELAIGEVGEDEMKAVLAEKDGCVAFSQVGCPSTSSSLSLVDEVHACFANLSTLLATYELSLLSLQHLSLYLAPEAMTSFPSINEVYTSYFGSSPPSRACVSVVMPISSNGRRVVLEGLARRGDEAARKSLHVQSISYWAAANIGPYSQSILAGTRLTIAGQISLLPATLSLPTPFNYPLEVTLSLQHLRRVVLAATEGRWTGWAESGVCWIARAPSRMEWGRRLCAARQGLEDEDGLGDAPVLFVMAENLPKSAAVEWQLTWQTGVATSRAAVEDGSPDTDDEDDDAPASHAILSHGSTGGSEWASSASAGSSGDTAGYYVCRPDHNAGSTSQFGKVLSVRAFHLPSISSAQVRALAHSLFGTQSAVTTIGTGRVATRSTEGWGIGFVVLGRN